MEGEKNDFKDYQEQTKTYGHPKFDDKILKNLGFSNALTKSESASKAFVQQQLEKRKDNGSLTNEDIAFLTNIPNSDCAKFLLAMIFVEGKTHELQTNNFLSPQNIQKLSSFNLSQKIEYLREINTREAFISKEKSEYPNFISEQEIDKVRAMDPIEANAYLFGMETRNFYLKKLGDQIDEDTINKIMQMHPVEAGNYLFDKYYQSKKTKKQP